MSANWACQPRPIRPRLPSSCADQGRVSSFRRINLLPRLRWRSSSTNLNRLIWSSLDRKSTRLNSSHPSISYAVFCLKKKKKTISSERICNEHERNMYISMANLLLDDQSTQNKAVMYRVEELANHFGRMPWST